MVKTIRSLEMDIVELQALNEASAIPSNCGLLKGKNSLSRSIRYKV